MGNRRMGQAFVSHICCASLLLTHSVGLGIQAPRLQDEQQGCAGQYPAQSTGSKESEPEPRGHDDSHTANGYDEQSAGGDTTTTATIARKIHGAEHSSFNACT